MITNYRVISISHRTLDVSEIGQFMIHHESQHQLSESLQNLKAQFGIDELQYLSTCNRLEFILYCDQEPGHEFLVALFNTINPDLQQEILNKIETFVTLYNGEQAVNHILEVACSLDSLVVGEREIFRQYRSSFEFAENEKLLDTNLRILQKSVVVAAKEVYSKTKIGEKSLSIVALAMEELMRRNPNIDARILLIGAGETNTLVMKFLKKKGFHNVTIFNRTLDNASKLSTTYGVSAAHLSQLRLWNSGFDIIFACTGATQAVLTEDIYKVLINREQNQKLLIDLAVPRNIESQIVDHYNTDYVSIDGLRDIANENLATRKQEMGAARSIIKKNLSQFIREYQQRQIQKVLNSVPREVKAIKEKVLQERYKKEIDKLDDDTRELIHDMVNYMEKTFISVPMKLAKESTAS